MEFLEEICVSRHLTADDVEAFFGEALTPERRREVLAHLFRGCPVCCSTAGWQGRPPADERQYEDVIDRALDLALRLEGRLSPEQSALEKAAAMLDTRDAVFTEAGLSAGSGDGLRGCELLLKKSWALRHDNPRRMVDLAHSALELARRLDPKKYDPLVLNDLLARTWGELGNAYRVSDELDKAERAFAFAFNFLQQGSGDPKLKARLHDLQASLYGTQRRFTLALGALDIVYQLYLGLGDAHLAGRALISKALYLQYSGRPEEALQLNEQGLALVEEVRDPALVLQALHNHLLGLVGCGRFQEARAFLSGRREKLAANGRVNEVKLHWIEGRISYGLGDLETAAALLLEARHGLVEAGLGFHGALCSLDLALVWLRQGRISDAEATVFEAASVFKGLKIAREVLGAVLVLREAIRLRTATVALAERVVGFIRHWELDPGIRFELAE